MDAEVSARTGAEYGERSPERVTQRNGYRSRAWDTRSMRFHSIGGGPKTTKMDKKHGSRQETHP